MTYRSEGLLTLVGDVAVIGTRDSQDTKAVSVFLAGTFTSGSVAFEVGLDAGTGPWFPVHARRASDGYVSSLSGDLGANGISAWTIPTLGAGYVRVRCVGLASGTINVNAIYPAPTFDATPSTSVSADVQNLYCVTLGVPNALTVQTGTSPLVIAYASTILVVTAGVTTAPTVTSAIFDVNKNATTIFTTQGNRPTIAAGTFTDFSGVPDVTQLAPGDVLTGDVDQIGSGVAGANGTLTVWLTRN